MCSLMNKIVYYLEWKHEISSVDLQCGCDLILQQNMWKPRTWYVLKHFDAWTRYLLGIGQTPASRPYHAEWFVLCGSVWVSRWYWEKGGRNGLVHPIVVSVVLWQKCCPSRIPWTNETNVPVQKVWVFHFLSVSKHRTKSINKVLHANYYIPN